MTLSGTEHLIDGEVVIETRTRTRDRSDAPQHPQDKEDEDSEGTDLRVFWSRIRSTLGLDTSEYQRREWNGPKLQEDTCCFVNSLKSLGIQGIFHEGQKVRSLSFYVGTLRFCQRSRTLGPHTRVPTEHSVRVLLLSHYKSGFGKGWSDDP